MHDYTLTELADVMHVNRETLARWARAGELPGAYKVGADWRVNRRVIDAYRAGRAQADEGDTP